MATNPHGDRLWGCSRSTLQVDTATRGIWLALLPQLFFHAAEEQLLKHVHAYDMIPLTVRWLPTDGVW